MSSILVTGGAGFIGSHLLDRLADGSDEIYVIDNFDRFYDPSIKKKNIIHLLDSQRINLITADIRNRNKLMQIVRAVKPVCVFHLAALAGIRNSTLFPNRYYDVNVMGTLNLLDACVKVEVQKIIFASSSSVYGNSNRLPFSEDDSIPNPMSIYGMTKLCCESLIQKYNSSFGIKAVCARLFTVYGPRQRPDMAIRLFICKIIENRKIELRFNAKSSRDYTFIDDIVDGLIKCRAAEIDYDVINLGSSHTTKLSDVVKKLETLLGKKADILYVGDNSDEVEHTQADISKAKSVLGYNPKVLINDGMSLFADWFLQQKT